LILKRGLKYRRGDDKEKDGLKRERGISK